ncbi:WLM-domain-containing protein [Athelia psychrophila]|uniref:WLM-domain-containing protein n=1 Tax=Athelia psychrophila TaxID=1759441 RepID=A0A166G882_9AGAM|nr:WLM-domain-containing protein [Fibularhizoctonia sp. CBS 109695]
MTLLMPPCCSVAMHIGRAVGLREQHHRGVAYPLSLLPDSTLASLYAQLEELTGVPPPLQKLLYKGKRAADEDAALSAAGIKNGLKIQMLGSTQQEIGGLHAAETEQQRINRILRDRALKGPTKLRSTGSSSSGALSYRFHAIQPLQHLPNPSSALAMLTRLSNDPAIRHIMQTHKFSVGLLTELAPHEHPELLGLNVNAGQEIKLRIRTNAYDGFRLYRDIRMVLCHELAHNVWGDHDDDFKELNSKLNKAVIEFERASAAGTHTLMGDVAVYEPPAELEAAARANVLGGSDPSRLYLNESMEERRARVLNATMNRLRKAEEEVETSCGTAGPAAGGDATSPST